MALPTTPPSPKWTTVRAEELTNSNVGNLARLNWTAGQTITGRLSALKFSHTSSHYTDGSMDRDDPTCSILLELGDSTFEKTIPLNAQVDIPA